MRIVSRSTVFATMAIAMALLFPRMAQADEASELQALVERASPSIVVVKVVMKTTGQQGADRETKADMIGVVVDRSGIVMMSNMMFAYARVNALLGRNVGGAEGFKTYPTEMTTLFDQDEKEYPTSLVATDSKLDLAFVKVEGLGSKKLTPIEFNHGGASAVGQEVVSISRLHKGFDYAPYFMTSRICAPYLSRRRRTWLRVASKDWDCRCFRFPANRSAC